MKKLNLRTALLVCLTAGAFTLGAAAATGAQQISAMLRPDITIKLNGESQAMYDKNGTRVYPIEYQGSTYLPIRAIGTLLDQEVVWDTTTQTVFLSTKLETKPEELTYAALSGRATQAENRYTTLNSDVLDTPKAETYAENLTIYHRLNGRCTELKASLKTLQVDVTEAARTGKITQAESVSLADRLTSLDAKLKALQSGLAQKYNIDTPASTATALWNETVRLRGELPAVDALVTAAEKAASYETWKPAGAAALARYKTLRGDVTTLQLALNESLRQSVLTFSEYNRIAAECDTLDNACKAFKERLDLAEKAWVNANPDGSLTDGDAEFYTQKMIVLGDKADRLFVKCREYFTNKSRNPDAAVALVKELIALDRETDALEDAIEESDKLGRQSSWELLRRLDKVDDTLDKAEDFLEKAGIDDDLFDDLEEEHDRGWHHGKDRD